MSHLNILRTVFLLFISVIGLLHASRIFAYEVVFKGITDEKLNEAILSTSQLYKLKDSPPSTELGLKRRAESDLKNILMALHSRAYFGATVSQSLDASNNTVTVNIDEGPIYSFSDYHIRFLQEGKDVDSATLGISIDLKDVSVVLGEPALPEVILNAEEALLKKLNQSGFAFASIKSREVFADHDTHHVIVWLIVETGPVSYFGPLTIVGTERLKDPFFYRKLRWQQGVRYNPSLITQTEEALELSGLFHSISISTGEQPFEGNQVPLEITVSENKQRTLGFGLKYTTSLGPGFSAEWEDRNIFGEGQKLRVQTSIWEKLQEGNVTYIIPDFKIQDQNLIWLLDFDRERTKSFTENAVSFSASLERNITERLRCSYGGMIKHLQSQRSDFNGSFDLLKTPLQLRWSNADSILEPTRGGTLQLKVIPSLQFIHKKFAYCINTLTGTIYQSLSSNNRHIFAAKLTLGSIVGAEKHEIPPPERFYAGSEATLRGFRYLTVSPLEHDGKKPVGGRSMFIYTLEMRNRIGDNLGCVLFYDIGNVFPNSTFNFSHIMRQSIGIGLRYYTPVGPLRLDIAVPLNKRHIDNALEAYFSIGQSF